MDKYCRILSPLLKKEKVKKKYNSSISSRKAIWRQSCNGLMEGLLQAAYKSIN